MAVGPPFKTAYQYFAQTARYAIKTQTTGWSRVEIERTIAYLWWDRNLDRSPFQLAVGQRSRAMIPFSPNTVIPGRPVTSEELSRQRERYRSTPVAAPPHVAAGQAIVAPAIVPPALAVPTAPAAPAATKVDAYPFPFWPDTWQADPDVDGIPNLRLWNRGRESADPGREEVQKNWLEMEVTTTDDLGKKIWHGVKFLGQGEYGSCGLFVQVDNHDIIQDRMVVKEAFPFENEWNNPIHWRDKRPREIDIHQRIEKGRKSQENDEGYSCLARFRGYRLLMDHQRYRLYLDFYPSGDMYQVLRRYFTAWEDVVEPEEVPKTIPESYIWYVFSALVDAVRVLQLGRTPEKLDEWKPITHCDLKLENILIDADEKGSGKWSRPVIADFGLAFHEIYGGDDPTFCDNPREYVNMESNSDYAPEQAFADPSTPIKLNEKTDVWAIGKIIWNLLTHSLDSPAREFSNGEKPSKVTVEDLKHKEEILTGSHYKSSRPFAEELKTLVRRCLAYEQADRPSLDDLRKAIDEKHGNDRTIKEPDSDKEFRIRTRSEFLPGKTYTPPES